MKGEDEVIDVASIIRSDGGILDFYTELYHMSKNLLHAAEGRVEMDSDQQWADHIIGEVRRFFRECESQILEILERL